MASTHLNSTALAAKSLNVHRYGLAELRSGSRRSYVLPDPRRLIEQGPLLHIVF